ncbi:efflux transporter, RND family, MFP subunit [Ostertagia ostertagi]
MSYQNRFYQYFLSALAAGCLGSLLPGCASYQTKENEEIIVKAAQPTAPETKVATTICRLVPFEYIIQSNGKIKAQRDQLITSAGSARLVQLHAVNGMNVNAGFIIARLETTAIEARLQRAELARYNGEKEYQSQLLGYENLLKDKSTEQAEAIKKKLKIAAGLSLAEQEIREAHQEMEKMIIRAPFSGLLADVKTQQGQQLKAGDEMFRIYDPQLLELEIKVLESDIHVLRLGTPASVQPLSSDSSSCTAKIVQINPYVDENGMVAVKLSLQNKTRQPSRGWPLFPGMNCSATIRVGFARAITVPREAVVMRNGKAVVFTLEKGHARWNYVVTGRENGEVIEIREGLASGQKVIITNNLQLTDDTPVTEAIPPERGRSVTSYHRTAGEHGGCCNKQEML